MRSCQSGAQLRTAGMKIGIIPRTIVTNRKLIPGTSSILVTWNSAGTLSDRPRRTTLKVRDLGSLHSRSGSNGGDRFGGRRLWRFFFFPTLDHSTRNEDIEPSVTGLVLRSNSGEPFYGVPAPRPFFREFEQIPPIVIDSFLFVENRELQLDSAIRPLNGTAWPRQAFCMRDGTAHDGTRAAAGDKTGSGDNRWKGRNGRFIRSRSSNRTATFVFCVGDRYFEVIRAYVEGIVAEDFRFTSALPVAIVRLVAPSINARLASSSDKS
jgi:hypothetical protein